jgi:glycosyltransferase involved in cell wall biosynthesis
MNDALVSVIIPVFNREQFVGQAIESALKQTYPSVEIIVIDDGSTDNTAVVVNAFKGRLRHVHSENGGPAAARNRGLELAQGEFIAFLDSDDLWPADKLKMQLQYLLAHPEIQYTIGQVTFFLEPGASPPPGFRKELLEGPRVGRLLQAMVARKAVFDVVGPFDSRLRTAEDVDWFCRANDLNVSMAVVQEIVVEIRVHQNNIALTTTRNNKNLLRVLKQSVQRKISEKSLLQ